MTIFGILCSKTSFKSQYIKIWRHPLHLSAAFRLGITDLPSLFASGANILLTLKYVPHTVPFYFGKYSIICSQRYFRTKKKLLTFACRAVCLRTLRLLFKTFHFFQCENLKVYLLKLPFILCVCLHYVYVFEFKSWKNTFSLLKQLEVIKWLSPLMD